MSKFLKVLLGIIVVIVLILVIAASCGTNSDKSGHAPDRQKPGTEDVTISNCNLSEDLPGTFKLSVDVSIENHSSKPSNYLVTTGFENEEGDQLGTGTAAVVHLNPGQKSKQPAISLLQATKPKELHCTIADITRYAA
jgi:hypothetical protein